MSNATENSVRLLELGTGSQSGVSGGGPLTGEQSALVREYIRLIKRWDRAHSLVSKGDLNHLEQRHVLDSLTLAPFLKPCSDHLDIGSGAGFPGVPIAISRPDVRVVVNDRSKNKCRFLREVKFRLNLTNVEVLQHDIGSRSWPREPFDSISIRAVAPPETAWSLAWPLLHEHGTVLLHTRERYTTDNKDFPQGVVLSCTPSARGWITVVGMSSAA